jgi:uncharacterized membrane-anchored protein
MKKVWKMKSGFRALSRQFAVVGVLAATSFAGVAQEAEQSDEELEAQANQQLESLGWDRSGRGDLGNVADIAIPEGYRFTGVDGTKKLMSMFGNRISHKEMGTLAPESLEWFVVFEFDKVGYVKDDEKDELVGAADELLEVFKKGQAQDNERRRDAGMETLSVVGWAKEPFYNEETNNLEWALKLRDASGNISVNYKTKLLGRNGVMESVLVCEAAALEQILPTYQGLIVDFAFVQGNSYAEYKKGDKIADVGLKALIVGGGAFVAAKLGLFGVLFKFLGKIWIVLVAAAVGLKSYIGRIFKGKKSQYTVDQ